MKFRTKLLLMATAVVIIAVLLALSSLPQLMEQAKDSLAAALSESTGTVVTVGEVEITAAHVIAVKNLAVYDKNNQPLAYSTKISIEYDVWQLLQGRPAAEAISQINAEGLALWLAQSRDGKWNVEDLGKKDSQGGRSRFAGKINVDGGTVYLSALGGSWLFENVGGSVDIGSQQLADFLFKAVYKGNAVKLSGFWADGGRNMQAKAMLAAVNADDVKGLLPEGSLVLHDGEAQNAELVFTRRQGVGELRGSAGVRGVALDIDGVPLRSVQGSISFENKKMELFVKGEVLEQPVRSNGSVNFAGKKPLLDLTVRSDRFFPAAIQADVPLRGQVAFALQIKGPVSEPVISGDIEMNRGEVAGYELQKAKAAISLQGNKLTVLRAEGRALGGEIALRGQVDIASWQYQLQTAVQNIDLGACPLPVAGIYGQASGEAVIAGQGSSMPQISGMVTASGGVAGVNVAQATAGFYYHDGITALDYVNLTLPTGSASATGHIDQQGLNLNFQGENIPLALLDRQNKGLFSGSVRVEGTVSGSLDDPQVILVATAADGQVFKQPFKQAKGQAVITRQQAVLQNVELTDGRAWHFLQGSIALGENYQLDLHVQTRQARGENIIQLFAAGERLTGNISNEVHITGTPDQLNAQGHAVLTEGSFRGQLIDRSELFYQREQGVLTVSRWSINSLNTLAELRGTMGLGNQLDFEVEAQNIDMERLHVKLPYAVKGKAVFQAKLSGTLEQPLFSGKFEAPKLSVNDQEVVNISSGIVLDGQQVEIPYLNFQQGNGRYTFLGGFSLTDDEVYGSLEVENADIKTMVAMLALPDKEIQGCFDGNFRIHGKKTNPNIWLTGQVRAGSIKKYKVNSVKIDAALENGRLAVNELSAQQDKGVLAVRGTALLGGAVNMEVGGKDIDAGLVASFFDTTLEPTGKIGFAAQITGTTDNPQSAVSLEIANGGVGSATFDSLYGLLLIDRYNIHVNQLLLKKGKHQASAYGIVPIAAINPIGRQNASIADQMDLKLRLDEADLSILPFLTQYISWAEGKTQGEIEVRGTLVQPVLTGSLKVHNGKVKPAGFNAPIEKIGINILFEGDTIRIQQFEGQMGKGSYSLSGQAKINGLGLSEYDLTLALNKPEISSKYFTGAVDGSLTLSGKNGIPKLAGKLLFENDIINIPIIPDMKPAEYAMEFDIEMRVGKKVRFYNPYLYDMLAEGRIKFAGSTAKPDFTGYIGAVRGSVNYLRTQFKINEASVSFKRFASFEPIVKLDAQTTLQQIVVKLAINGPLSNMQFALTSDPVMPQQEILSLLMLRSHYADKQSSGSSVGRDEVISVLGAGLQMQFVSGVEGTFRTVLGLDEFRLVQDTTSSTVKKSYTDNTSTMSQEAYNVEMSKYLTDRLLLSYTMGLDHTKSDLALRYTLNRWTTLNASIDERNRTWLGIETRFRF